MRIMDDTITTTQVVDLGNTILCMEIKKGRLSDLVLQSHEFVLVVSMDSNIADEPLILLAKVYSRTNSAHEEWLHIIGKMCTKSTSSKYFENQRCREHLKNGNIPEWSKKYFIDIAKTAVAARRNMEV